MFRRIFAFALVIGGFSEIVSEIVMGNPGGFSFFPKDIECLNELPMTQLLKIKRSLDMLTCDTEGEIPGRNNSHFSEDVESRTLGDDFEVRDHRLTALPLTEKNLGRSYDHDPWNQKPTKVQTIFQFSITALAFLAFGGYLLCMIVQAIKSKGTTYYHPTVIPTSTGGSGTLKKIKVYRNRRQATNLPRKNATDFGIRRAEPSPDELYKILVLAAEGYVHLSSI